MKKKIIIHNGNISIGGQERMLVEFLKILDSNKYEVLLLIEENNGDKNVYIEEIPNWIKYKFLTSEYFMKKLNEYKNSKNIVKKILYSYLLKKKKKLALKEIKKYLNFADIIIDYDMGLIRNLHKLPLENKKVIGWSHAGSGGKYKSKQKNKNLEKYDYIVAINEEMKRGYEANTKNPIIEKIYNFIDVGKIQKLSLEELPKDYKDKKYIVTVGALTENKNHILLIEAFSKLKLENKIEEKLYIIGEGKEKENLIKKIKDLKMEDEIFLLGKKINPYNFIKNAELYVSTSISEGLPVTFLEALALGKTVISTPNNGAKEVLDEKSLYGKVILDFDVENLAKEILFYLKNKNERFDEKSLERIKDFDRNSLKLQVEEFIDRL